MAHYETPEPEYCLHELTQHTSGQSPFQILDKDAHSYSDPSFIKRHRSIFLRVLFLKIYETFPKRCEPSSCEIIPPVAFHSSRLSFSGELEFVRENLSRSDVKETGKGEKQGGG